MAGLPAAGRAVRAGAGSRQRTVLKVLGALLVVYLAGPVVAFVVRFAGDPGAGMGTPGLGAALGVSALAATTSVAIIALAGIPLAYCLARFRGPIAGAIGLVVQLPLAVPPLMSGMLLVYLVGPYTPIGSFFHGALTESVAGVVLAQTFVAAPFLIVVARATFATIPDDLFDVAATLGHGELGRFVRVALPVARDGIFAGLLLSWLRAFGEYGATVILAYHPYTLPVFTFVQFQGTGLAFTQAPTALALVVATAVVALSHVPLRETRGRALPAVAPSVPPPKSAGPLAFALAYRVGTFHLEIAHPAGVSRLAILGPSGSGKSLTLRALAGLLGPGVGTVTLGGDELGALPPGERGVGYLPQHSGLLPHLAVARQLTFGVGASPGVARHWIDRLGLGPFADRRVGELSGGQRQRVALARALCREPRLLLLDEPFSALDRAVRTEMQREVRRLQLETGLTSVVVTHDFDEASLLADEILVIEAGRLVQCGSAEELYRRPATAAVAKLAGLENVHLGTVLSSGQLLVDGVPIAIGPLAPAGAPALFVIAPEAVGWSSGDQRALVIDLYFRGGHRYAQLLVEDRLGLVARLPDGAAVAVGERYAVDLGAGFAAVREPPSVQDPVEQARGGRTRA